MDMTTILVWASLALAPQAPKTPTSGDDFFVGKGQTEAAPRDLAAWRREIARVQLLLEVDGKVKEARNEALTLWDQLGRSAAFEGRSAVVLDALDLATRILEKTGEHERIAKMLDPAQQPAALREDYARIDEDPRMAAIRTRAEGATKPTGADAARIEQIVRESVRGGTNEVNVVGSAAVPTLEQIAREDPEYLGGTATDALYILAGFAPARAGALCVELLKNGRASLVLQKRVLRVMQNGRKGYPVLSGVQGAWRFEKPGNWNERAPDLLEPVWREVLTLLVASPLVFAEAAPLVTPLVEFDALDDPLRAALLRASRSSDPETIATLGRLLEHGWGRPTVRPLLEALVSSSSPVLRVAAANELSEDPASPAILARVDDPEVRVRELVARTLRQGGYHQPTFTGNSVGTQDSSRVRRFEPQDRAVIAKLLVDRESSVRQAGLDVAFQFWVRLDAEVAERLIADESSEVRWKTVLLLPADIASAAPLLEHALKDSEEKVRTEAETMVMARFGVQSDLEPALRIPRPTDSESGRILRELGLFALEADGPKLGVASKRKHESASLLLALLARPEDVPHVVRWWFASRSRTNPLPAIAVLNALDSGAPGAPGKTRWEALDVDAAFGILRAVHDENSASRENLGWLSNTFRSTEEPLRGAVVRLARDATLQRAWRIAAALGLLESDPADPTPMIAALTVPSWTSPIGNQDLNPLAQIKWARLTPAASSALLKALWTSDVPDAVLVATFARAAGSDRVPDELVLPVYERIGGDSNAGPIPRSTAEWAARTQRWDVLQKLLAAYYGSHEAILVLGRQRPAEGLGWLSEVLLDRERAATFGVLAANAVAGYLSEEAGDVLLRAAAAAPSEEVRKAALEGVEQIRQYLDQKSAWQQRASGQKQRDSAVVELAAMLDSPDAKIRAQAARGLATLEAVEHLPRLIRLGQDADPEVRKAAAEAVERLNQRR